jgi:hypothetical protein
MAFWSDTGLDPKRQFKFKVTFSRLGSDAQYLAQTADRPVYTITDGTKVEFLDKTFHYPGKISWAPVKIKFVDTVGVGRRNLSRDSYNYLANSGWISPNDAGAGAGNFSTISKASAASAAGAGTVQVSVLDSNGTAVDIWTLKNAFITTVALNNLDYAAEGILTAEYTFRYDWADLKSPFDT